MRSWIGAIFAILALTPAEVRAQSDDHVIVPGERVGLIRLGMSQAELYRAMGDASSVVDAANYGFRDGQIGVGIEGGRVSGVSVTDPAYTTPDGLRPGATQFALTGLYGPPRRVVPPGRGRGGNYSFFCYPKFTAWVNASRVVERIAIGPSRTCGPIEP